MGEAGERKPPNGAPCETLSRRLGRPISANLRYWSGYERLHDEARGSFPDWFTVCYCMDGQHNQNLMRVMGKRTSEPQLRVHVFI